MRSMIGTDEILARLESLLEAGKIQKKEIAAALNITPQRISDHFSGDRKLKLDEAQRLVETFGLEDPAELISAIATIPVLKLLVAYAVRELAPGTELDESRIEDIARDVQAFLRYVCDPKVRQNVDLAEGFFLALQAMEPEATPTSA